MTDMLFVFFYLVYLCYTEAYAGVYLCQDIQPNI